MKSFGYFALVMLLGPVSCSSQKKLQTQVPFEIGKATCQQWLGGREESGIRTILKIPISGIDVNTFEMKEVFFRGEKVPVVTKEEDGITYAVADIPNSKGDSAEAKDLMLEATEAVLSYTENGKLRYTKITGIKDRQPIIYKDKPKN